MSTNLRDKPKGTGTLAPPLVPAGPTFFSHTESTQNDCVNRAPNHAEANRLDHTSTDSRETVGRHGPQLGRYYSPDSDDAEKEKVYDNNTPQKLSDERGEVLGKSNGLSWMQVSALLGAEYISLAILSFPWVCFVTTEEFIID